MSYLLNTKILPEWAKPDADDGLRRWSEQTDEHLLFLSAVSNGDSL
ncbi:MAG TPA: hypothetical protein VNF74_14710 [Terriglobales bacterium]|nr:hypothetical protein [Terriglobales bacterium]